MRKYNKPIVFKSSKPSLAKPNQALTVRQINERFVSGKPIPVAKQPIHEPKLENGINPTRIPYCDFTDIAIYNDGLVESLNEAQSLYTEKRKKFDEQIAKAQKEYEDHLSQRIQKKDVI